MRLVLAFGQSCSSADGTTEGLFESERYPEGASGGLSSGGAAVAVGGRSSTGGAGASFQRRLRAASLRTAVEAAGRGGRASPGGRGGKAGGGGPAGGAASGGKAGGPSGGGTNGGGVLNEGGFGGSEPPLDCDDGDPCTVDEPDTQGICHFSPKCIARSACEAASCDAGTGECEFGAVDEGGACDDQRACTSDDSCTNGSCAGVTADLVATTTDARLIPDGAADCGGNQPVIVDFTLPQGGVVTGIEVGIKLNHPNLSNLYASILHVQSNRQAVLFSVPEGAGRGLSGYYVFASGGPSLAEAAAETEINQEVTPDRYAGTDDLGSWFDGDQAQGTWRLSLTDLCLEDTGEFLAADLRIERTCE